MDNCQAFSCDNSPIAICLHCQEYLCVDHLLQHNEQLLCEANMYCHEFNELTEKIENMSFDKQFKIAEEDLNEWLNDQMKQLDKIYEQKLDELHRLHNEVKDNLKNFKEIQQKKLVNIRRLFNSKLNKQINFEQLNQMKIAVEQLRKDIHQFQRNQCEIKLDDNEQMNYSYQPNIEIHLDDQECNKSKQSQLRADAKPFEFIPKDSLSPIPLNTFSGRVFDECLSTGSSNKTI